MATGRQPRTTDIGLDVVGLEAGKSIAVDDQMRAKGVSGDWLYAIGDVNGLALLTHVGKYQARLVGDVIAGKDVHDIVSKDIVPRVTFTDPQVCAVGLTERQARERYDNVRTVSYGTGDVAGAHTSGNDIKGTSFPYNRFPYVVLGWLVLGALITLVFPKLVRRIGENLSRAGSSRRVVVMSVMRLRGQQR